MSRLVSNRPGGSFRGFGGPGGGFRTGKSSGKPLLLPALKKPPPGPPKPLPGPKTTARTIRNEPGQLETGPLYAHMLIVVAFLVVNLFGFWVIARNPPECF